MNKSFILTNKNILTDVKFREEAKYTIINSWNEANVTNNVVNNWELMKFNIRTLAEDELPCLETFRMHTQGNGRKKLGALAFIYSERMTSNAVQSLLLSYI